MHLVKDIYNCLDRLYPFKLAMDFDNCGLLVGNENNTVTKAICCLDVTLDVVNEAKSVGAELIISHHPVIFNPIKKLDSSSLIYNLVSSKINVISAHTNLDIAPGGVNSCLAKKLDLKNLKTLSPLDNYPNDTGLGLVGEIENPVFSSEFAEFVKKKLDCNGLRFTNIENKRITRVAVGSGSCGNLIDDVVLKKVDAFVTGEIKHHEILFALQNNVVVVDVGHFKSEDIVISPLVNVLQKNFPLIKFLKSTSCTDKIEYI